MGEKRPWTISRFLMWAFGLFLFAAFISAMVDRKEAPSSETRPHDSVAVAEIAAPAPVATETAPAPKANLGGAVAGFAKIFNDKSASIDAGVKAAKGSCQSVVRTACDYTLANGLTIIAGSADDKTTLADLTIHLLTDDKLVAVKYIGALAVILRLYAPKASRDEIGAVMSSFMSQVTKGDAAARIRLHGIRVQLTAAPPMGSFTSVSRD